MKSPRTPRPSADELRGVRDTVLRAVSLVVTDRRWAAPLSAMALGFGLFLGVAIGPGAAGTFATGAGDVIAVTAPGSEEEPEAVETAEPEAPAPEPEPEAFTAESEPSEAFAEPAFEPVPFAEVPPEEEAPPAEETKPEETEEEAETQELKGTVIHTNPVAGSYTMAIAGGELVSVHTSKLPLPGEKLTVAGSPLPNNTFAEEEREKAGSAKQGSLRGVVTYVDPDPAAPAYTLSGRGSSILIHLPPSPAPTLPELGAYATVKAQIEKPAPVEEPVAPEAVPPVEPAPAEACAPDPALKSAPAPKLTLVQRSIETEPEPATYFDLAGVVSALCPATKQLLISADDLRASEDDLLLAVPDNLETDKLKVGESIVATATVEEDGTLTLSGLASDEGEKGAETTASAQGDLKR